MVNPEAEALVNPEADWIRGRVKKKLDGPKNKLSESVKAHSANLKELEEFEKRFPPKPSSRKDIKVPPWWYSAVLVLVGVVEWMLNYNSFLDNYGVPAMAAGLTVLVAVIVAFASHEHGSALRQRAERFHKDDEVAVGQWVLLVFTTAGLVAALVLVAWVRYTWVEGLIGRGIEDVSVWPKVLQTLLGNLIIWVIGSIVAFLVHGENPHLQRLEEQCRRSEKKCRRSDKNWKKARKRFTKETGRQKRLYLGEEQGIRDAVNEEITEAENTIPELEAKPIDDIRDDAPNEFDGIEPEEVPKKIEGITSVLGKFPKAESQTVEDQDHESTGTK